MEEKTTKVLRTTRGNAIPVAHAIKGKAITARVNLKKAVKLAGAAYLKDMPDILQEMNKHKAAEDREDTQKPATTTFKLTPERSCCLTDMEKKKLAKELHEAGGPQHMEMDAYRLLMNTVGKSIASYSPGTNDLLSLPSATPLASFIANEAAKITGSTPLRRVPAMDLLKLIKLRMTMGDRWKLDFFGPMVAKNGEVVSKTIKKEANQLSEATYTQEREDIWSKLEDMANFGIAARGLAAAVDLFVNPSIITKGEVME